MSSDCDSDSAHCLSSCEIYYSALILVYTKVSLGSMGPPAIKWLDIVVSIGTTGYGWVLKRVGMRVVHHLFVS